MKECSTPAQIKACRALALERNRQLFDNAHTLNRAAKRNALNDGLILAIRDDDVRVDAIGFPSYRYKWVLFVIAGTLGGLAGALMVNHQNYVSPNLMHWTQSGILMVMVILGGVGTLTGGLWGALVLLILEDVLAEYTLHWQFYVGWFLLAVVLLAPKGLAGLIRRKAANGGEKA